MYFGKEQEKLIRQYIETKDERLYEKHIDPLLNSIAQGVRGRYGFKPVAYYTSPGVINGCKSLLWEKLINNFDPSKNKKAFSYLTRVAHHYFCGVARKIKMSTRTLRLVAREADVIWNLQHAEHRDAESRMVDVDISNIKADVAKMFLRRSFDVHEVSFKAIMKDIEGLPSANKKAVNEVLRRNLWPNVKAEKGTKRIYKAKTKFDREGFTKAWLI